ncbi:hypothetical protein [Natrinema salaciae]|uniref:Uncharacterized protein n=1 Tax=Natrinema salaciae TaxID=1186196 RepID=A0A1H9JQB6_9EURY|nr:hypothetical protein [Natrinema salaciae]SEQ89016.1 hypothetical protein SAMN04489841_2647 [Natrinema salaciae]
MPPNLRSRRNVLAAGVGLGGFGIGGIFALKSDKDEELPGPQGFSAMLAPAGSDPLVMAHVDDVLQSGISKNVLHTLLSASQFDDLPDALTKAFDTIPETAVDIDSVGTLLLVGSDVAKDAGGAVVWANWTADDLVTVLESQDDTDIQSESYRGQTIYTAGETSAAKVGETVFMFGTSTVVRDLIVSSTDDDAKPVGGKTLDSFARTPLSAHVRFSFETLGLSCNTIATSAKTSSVYDGIQQVYGSVPDSGDEVRFHLRVDPSADRQEIATTVRDELGTVERDFVDNIEVTDEHDFVAIQYSHNPDEKATVASEVLGSVVCRSNLSG